MSNSPNSQSLTNLILEMIQSSPQKRITFADYMNLVLYHPQQGYYSSGEVKIGAKGDFFTSSSLGADFGELLAEEFVEMWNILGCPHPFILVEMGAGTGLLAQDILSYLYKHHSDLFSVLEYIIIEQAESLIETQKELLNKWLDKKAKICWKSWQEIADNSIIGCAFSNELVDALPVHQVTIQSGKLQEIYITYDNGKLQEIIDEISNTKLTDYFKLVDINLSSSAYPDGYRTEVNLSALNWLETVSRKLKQGYLLTIDYGYSAQKYYHPQRYQGTLKCYYQHRHHNDAYSNIGYQDITTHVDFTALEKQGELLGLKKLGFTQQGMFLMALGLGERLNNLSSGKFNFQEILKRRDTLHQLIDPSGLGGFGVLVQSKGLNGEEKEKSLQGLTVPNLF